MSRTRQTICIVEDDESVRKAVRRLIQAAGLTAETFASAEEFLHSTLQPPPDCLVLDIRLPGLSGLQLQERLQVEGRNLPVVFITAYADAHVRELALRGGALAFLEKPFEERALLDAVARGIGAAASDT